MNSGKKAQVVIDLKEKKTFSALRVYARKSWSRQAITKATLYVSDDGLVWAKSKKQCSAAATDGYFDAEMWVGNNSLSIKFNVSARYIKLEIEETPMGVWSAQEIVLVDEDESLMQTASNLNTKEAISNELAAPYKTDEITDVSISSVTGSNSGNLTADLMFDGVTEGIANANAHWESPYNASGSEDVVRTVTVVFDKPVDMGGVRIYPRLDNPGGMIKHLTVYGSYDGTNYSILADNVQITFETESSKSYWYAVQGDTLRVDFPVSAKGLKAVKLQFDDNINGNKKFVTVAETRFLKAKDAPSEINLSSDSGVYADNTAIARFITTFKKADNADDIEYYGTYVLPEGMFNSENYQDKYAGKFEKKDADYNTPSVGKAYAVDLKKIPSDKFNGKFYAISFVKYKGSDVIIWSDSYTLSGVNTNKKLASEGE